MGLKAHLHARVAALFVGFFGGFFLFVFFVFGKPHGSLTPLLFFGMIFGGAYLAQLAFSHVFPAACPKCGQASAVPTLRKPVIYACRACGTATNALQTMLAGQLATVAQQERRGNSGGYLFALVFMLLGLGAAVVGGVMAAGSVRLVAAGISVPAQVMKVTRSEGRDSDGKPQWHYAAQIQYHAGKTVFTLERSWSEAQSGFHRCFAGCYDQGEMLKVIYLPGEPTTAKVDSFSEVYFFPGMLLAIGLAFFAFGTAVLRRRIRAPRGGA